MARYWRIRLKNWYGDFTRQAWERNEIGIWYGAWSANDFRNANDQDRTKQQIADILNDIPTQRNLGWEVTGRHIDTARRFFDKISQGDWVVTYLEDEHLLALAQMSGTVHSESSHPLNTESGELFKFRTIREKKTFALSKLPDAYMLISTQGRANVHEFSTMYDHIDLLVRYQSADKIIDELSKQSFIEQLDYLGAPSWESFCVAWLIMERHFVPTGLSTGKTLKDVDIVGRSRTNGKRIVGQCKKNNGPISIEEGFIRCLAAGDEAYYFAYGGCTDEPVPAGIRIIDRDYALQWSQTESGKEYQRLLLGCREKA